MNQKWITIEKLIGQGFSFEESFDDTITSNECQGMLNHIRYPQVIDTFDQLIHEYELELDLLSSRTSSLVVSNIIHRNTMIESWIGRNLTPSQFEASNPYIIVDTYRYKYGHNPNAIEREITITDPPCTKIRIEAYQAFYKFHKTLIQLHLNYFGRFLGSSNVGFKASGSVKACYLLLKGHRFIDCTYSSFNKVFTGKFSGSDSDMINWIGSAASLRYFIKQITNPRKKRIIDRKKWKTASTCIKLDGQVKTPTDLSGSQRKLDRNIMAALDETVQLLFPMSQ